MDRNAKILLEQSSDDGHNKLDDDFEMCSEEESGITSSCRHVMSKETASQSPTMNSTPIKSQIVITSSTEMPLSSDESVMIDVGVEPNYHNFFGSLNDNEVHMEIVENFYENNDETMENVTIVDSHAGAPQKFLPLTYEQRWIAGLKLNLVLNIEKHKVIVDGVGTVLKKPPVIFHKALGNGVCLFNSFLILLAGWDTCNAIIHHVICNYCYITAM